VGGEQDGGSALLAESERQGGAVSVLRMAVANTLAVPGRSVLGALGLAVGILALTMLLAVTLAFRGAVVGSVLGDAVSVQVRTIDYVSVAITLALGILGLADVLYLNVRDRAAELASLRATGWPERALNRMIALEGLLTGTAGGGSRFSPWS
jgi:ABC-type antimicrobial peptide transport system permease subunit